MENKSNKNPCDPKYILALGTNLQDRYANITSCIRLVQEHFEVNNISSIYETKAQLLQDSPRNWDMPFYNCALSVTDKNRLMPHNVLRILKGIEHSLGRDKGPESKKRWSPRLIDIDIILLESGLHNLESNSQELIIPHPRFLERDFVILPLKEIESDFYIAKLKIKVSDIDTKNIRKHVIRKVYLWDKTFERFRKCFT